MSGNFRHARLIVVATTVALAACATGAQRQYEAMVTNGKVAGDQVATCSAAAYNSPEFEPVRPHLPPKLDDATLVQLADQNFPNDNEIAAIVATHPKYNACRQAFLNQLSQTAPSLAAIWAALYTKNEAVTVQLVQKKLPWGEYLTRAKANASDTKLQLNQESQRIVAGLNRSHEAELARRQAAANAMAQYMQTQQIINNMNRPVVTNCNQFGTMVNCVSQ
jgi:hypothetical protein